MSESTTEYVSHCGLPFYSVDDLYAHRRGCTTCIIAIINDPSGAVLTIQREDDK